MDWRKDFISKDNEIEKECILCKEIQEKFITFRCYPELIIISFCSKCIEYAYRILQQAEKVYETIDNAGCINNYDCNCF